MLIKRIIALFIITLSSFSLLKAQNFEPQLIIPSGNTGRVDHIAFSPDSKFIASSFGSEKIVVWNILSGKITHTFRTSSRVTALTFHPQLPWIIASTVTGNIHFQRYLGNAEDLVLKAHEGAVNSMEISHNGKIMVTNGNDQSVKVWDFNTKNVLSTVNASDTFHDITFDMKDEIIVLGGTSGHLLMLNGSNFEKEFFLPVTEGSINTVDISINGQYLFIGDSQGFLYIWETSPMKQIKKSKVFQNQFYSLKIYNNFILSSGRDPSGNFKIINTDSTSSENFELSYREDKSASNFIYGINTISLSPENLLAIPDHNGLLRIFDLDRQQAVTRLRSYSYPVHSLIYNEGKISYNTSNSIQVMDITGNTPLQTIPWKNEIYSFERKNKQLLITDYSSVITLTNDQGEPITSFPVTKQALLAPVQFGIEKNTIIYRASPDLLFMQNTLSGKIKKLKSKNCYQFKVVHDQIITISDQNKIEIFQGQKLKKKKTYTTNRVIAFDTDQAGKSFFGLFPVGERYEIRKIDLNTGSTLYKMQLPDSVRANRIYFAGGNNVFTVSRSTGKFNQREDYRIYYWDIEHKTMINALKGHEGYVNDLEVSSAELLFSASMDGTIRAWQANSSDELFSLIPLKGKNWAAVTPSGLFDGSQGALNKMHYNLNNHIVPLQQMKGPFYEPGLVRKLAGFSSETFYNHPEGMKYTMYPDIKIQAPRQDSVEINIHNNGGGIGPVTVKINGKEIVEDITTTEIYHRKENSFKLSLNHPFIQPEKLNKLTIEAFNQHGFKISNQRHLYFVPEETTEKPIEAPRLFILSIGISDYKGKAIDLKYAAKDATDFADAFEIAGVAQYGKDNFLLSRMTTDSKTKANFPLKSNIISTFKNIAKEIRPNDIFLVYFAGHGLDLENDDEFYFLTADAEFPYVKGKAEAQNISLSSSELADLFKMVPSGKQVLIVDACHSGNLANGLFSENGQLKTEGIRALDKVKDRTGLFILASSEGEEKSYESSYLEQGLLTYSLLFGLKGEALEENEFLNIIDLLQYSRKKVPELAEDIGQRQVPIIQIPQDASSFYLGRLGAEEKSKIVINSPKPIVVSANFQNDNTMHDEVHASLKLDDIIKSYRSTYQNKYLFVDKGGVFSNAYSVYGRYTEENGLYIVNYRIFNGDVELKSGKTEPLRLNDALENVASELLNLLFD